MRTEIEVGIRLRKYSRCKEGDLEFVLNMDGLRVVKCCSRRRPRWSSLMRYSCLAMILEAFACSQRADPCRKVRSVARLLPPTLSANSIQKMKR